MHPTLRRLYIVGGLLLFAVVAVALLGAQYFRADSTTRIITGPGSLPPPLPDNSRTNSNSSDVQPDQRTLGTYPDTSTPLSSDTTVTPDAAPINITSINVSASTDFHGILTGDPTTGIVHLTDARPPGVYTVTIRAFNGNLLTATRTFRLTVITPPTCPAVNFAGTNFDASNGAEAVAIGDFNTDGKQDLAVANAIANSVSILFGDGAGHFTSPTNVGLGGGPDSIAVGDFNGDGKQDLAVANGNGVAILFGDGAGHFSAPTNFGAGGRPASVAIGDFNSDGKQDLAVANGSSNDISILLGDGAGNFSSPRNFLAGDFPQSVAVGEFNGDGRQDLAVANYDSNNVSIFFGDGSGNFSTAINFGVGENPQSVVVGDFNTDGNQDLAVANRSCSTTSTVSILLGNGAGSFISAGNVPTGAGPFSVAVADFNSDAKQDLATANYCSNPGTASVLLGDGAGHFTSPTNFGAGFQPVSVAVGDFNGDGKQDFAVVNFMGNNVSVLSRHCTPIPTPTPTPTPITPTPTPTPTTTPSPARSCPLLITHSTSQIVLPGNSQFPCVNGHVHNGQTDNSYWRAFNMQAFTGRRQYNVNAVSFGVQTAGDNRPVIIRLYTNNGAPFPGGTRTQIASTTVNITQTGTVITAPLAATVPAGTNELVMELFSPAAHLKGYFFFIGSNQSPETGPSYWSSPCTGGNVAVTSMHIILNVHGSCPGPTPTPSPTLTPTATPGPPSIISAWSNPIPRLTGATTLTVTNINDSGPGSLRQALADANDGDTIQFDPVLNGNTINLTSSELAFAKNISINGPGPNLLTVRAGSFNVLHILPGHTVLIQGLSIFGGDPRGVYNQGSLTVENCNVLNTVHSLGGGFTNEGVLTITNSLVSSNGANDGGGIFNSGTLTIAHTTVSDNIAPLTAGGIFNGGSGPVTISDSTISGNQAGNGGINFGDAGGIYHNGSGIMSIQNSTISNNTTISANLTRGGGILSSGPLEVVNSTITGNMANYEGGGIASSGTLTIIHSSITGNTAFSLGGGISNHLTTPSSIPLLTITDSTISGNHLGDAVWSTFGGGIFNNGTMTITNSTVSDNMNNGNMIGTGGGIYNLSDGQHGSLALSNSTISHNFALGDGGGVTNAGMLTVANSTLSGNWTQNGQGGGIVTGGNNAVLQIKNTILNTGTSGANIVSTGTGTITSLGYNLSSDNGGGFLAAPGDQINTDPILGPLQDNGGPTFTHAIYFLGPAANAGDPNFTPPPLYDQRGVGHDRVSNGRLDIGSFELQLGKPTPTPTAIATASATVTPTATATATMAASPTCVPDEPPLIEGFDDITTLPGNGWALINHSAVVGTTNWFQGNSLVFPAHSGAATSYIGANFNNTTGTNTISNWLLTTTLPLLNGRTMTFFTRTVDAPMFPDRLQVRMSTNGASTNVGTTATDVGDFTTLLLDINPAYTTSGYPNAWTQFTVTVSGVPTFTTGRLAFRYFVENGGPTGANSDYIGIDTFQFNDNGPCTGATPTVTPCPNGAVLYQNFDGVTAPALPAGWTASNAAGPGPLWVTSTTQFLSAPNAAFVDDPSTISDKRLDTPDIPIGGGFVQLAFENSYNLQSGFDGGVVEVSSPNINGGAFTDITDPAVGGSFLVGGYNATISTGSMSPLAGRMAWSGNSNGYMHSIANLGPNLIGQYIKLRFRLGSDNSGSAAGWRMDEVRVLVYCPTPSPTPITPSPTPTATATATPTVPPSPTPSCIPVITQSSAQTITVGNSVSCNNGTGHTDNSYWRAFNMVTITGGAAYNVISVSFGVESANNTQPVTVRLYTNSGGAFPGGTRTQIATSTISVTSANNGTVVLVPLPVTVPAGTSELVMELFTPDGQAAGNLFFVGSNTAPETGPSYLSAPACGVTTPTTTAALGFPNMHILFNIRGACPDTPTPTVTATATATATPTITPCPNASTFFENFDGVTAPVLPAGWSTSNAVGPPPLWVTSTTMPNSPPNDAFIDDPATVSDKRLDTFEIPISGPQAQVFFRNFYNFESTFDGGVLELSSSNINGGAFTDITDPTVGGSFVSGGYNATISTAFMSPIAGRMAWSGNSGGYIQTLANLGPNLLGHFIKLRFRMASDNSVSATGWRVDDFVAQVSCQIPSPTATATATVTATATATATATVTATPTPCTGTVVWSKDFDDLPVGTPGPCFYVSAVDPDTPPNDLFQPDDDGDSCCVYDFIGITIPNATSVLRFRNNFNVEYSDGIYWDGGVLEVSAPNISGGDFLDITDSHVGGSFVTGGYTGEIDGIANNCLAARLAWAGDSKGYIDTIINLGPNLAGQTVTFRFRFGASSGGPDAPGWRIDTITITDGICPTPTPTPTETPTPTPTIPPTATPTPSEGPCPGASCTPPRSLNLSTRMLVQTGDNVGIGGFIITGTDPKQVLLRAIGPSLGKFGVPNPLADPVMELHGPPPFTTVMNDNWRDTQETQIIATGLAPSNDLESAVLATIDPGNYTAVVKGKNDTSGVGLVEVYDLGPDTSQLGNISTRAFCGTGTDVVIGGFILFGGNTTANIVIRGVGPSLCNLGVPNCLADPTLELRDNNGVLLAENDNCGGSILPPTDPLEACIDIPLPHGLYTAILAGKNGGTGVGLVEIYNLN